VKTVPFDRIMGKGVDIPIPTILVEVVDVVPAWAVIGRSGWRSSMHRLGIENARFCTAGFLGIVVEVGVQLGQLDCSSLTEWIESSTCGFHSTNDVLKFAAVASSAVTRSSRFSSSTTISEMRLLTMPVWVSKWAMIPSWEDLMSSRTCFSKSSRIFLRFGSIAPNCFCRHGK
jgi:hypothetical protein